MHKTPDEAKAIQHMAREREGFRLKETQRQEEERNVNRKRKAQEEKQNAKRQRKENRVFIKLPLNVVISLL
jgi:hypothetical protein